MVNPVDKVSIEYYIPNIGKRVHKTSKEGCEPKPFKSTYKINTVKDVINHPKLNIPAYTFLEDESYVECRRCVVIESKPERALWSILKEDYGFTPHDSKIPVNTFNRLKRFLNLSFKTKTVTDDWLTADINGNHYDVMLVDIWYVMLLKNGETIFNKRRFKNEEFLKLIQ